MNERFISSNLFWQNLETYLKQDKHLIDLKKYKYTYHYQWQDEVKNPAVYILYGPRQVGKTTSIKQYIKKNIQNGEIKRKQCFYLSCDSLNDREDLYSSLKSFILSIDQYENSIVAVDEVTYIREWERSIKALIDEGLFRNTILILTGSDKILLENASSSFPGIDRRGKFAKDFILQPLSFSEFVKLIDRELIKHLRNDQVCLKKLSDLFTIYLQCGGYLNAINFIMSEKEIPEALFKVYESWIVSDFMRKGKEKKKLQDLLRLILEKQATQISYSNLAQNSVQISTDTVIEYISHLERLGYIRVLHAFDQNTFSSFPKKNKKIHFCDPFLAEVTFRWLKREGLLKNQEIKKELLVEGVVAEHYARRYQSYYIKAEGEVDLVYVKDAKFYPVEIKWSENIRPEELKQLKKYSNGTLLTRRLEEGNIENIKVENILFNLLAF